MHLISFLLRCKDALNDCVNRVLNDEEPEVRRVVLPSIEIIQRSLQWARGRWINARSIDLILTNLAELTEVIGSPSQSYQQDCCGVVTPLVSSGSSGSRSPPCYNITREQLTFLRSCGFTTAQMAEVMNVSVCTVRRRLRMFQLQRSYADLSDAALDDLVRQIVAGNDVIGLESVQASLRSQGINVQKRRVRDSVIRVNPRSAALRALPNRPDRRHYRSAGSNS